MAGDALRIDTRPIEALEHGFVVRLSGKLESEFVCSFDARITELAAGGQGRIVLDLSGLTYVDSSGLAALANISDNLLRAGGRMVLVQLPDRVRNIFDVLGFHAFFEVRPSTEEGAEYLRGCA